MKARQIFPLGKAHGKAFCNRTIAIQRLKGNIEACKHTLLLAPRRYGKSSLCERIFALTDLPWAKVDFHIAVSEKDVERLLLQGITEIISKAAGNGTEKLMLLAKKYAKKIQPKLGIGPESLRLELSVIENSSPSENIYEAILILDKILKNKKTQAVILLDEFQEIGVINSGRSIEGAIRSAAQDTQNLSIIFCGSNRHLLKRMFDDDRRPLYKLCRKMSLERIEAEHYYKHLGKIFKSLWKSKMPDDVFAKIMELTDRHPYYLNYLCDELCSICTTKMPTQANIVKAWDQVIEEERSDLLKEFSSLTTNQRKIVIFLAKTPNASLFSSESATSAGLPLSSMTRTINSLTEKDIIEKTEKGYRLMVPCFKRLLTQK